MWKSGKQLLELDTNELETQGNKITIPSKQHRRYYAQSLFYRTNPYSVKLRVWGIKSANGVVK